MNEEINEKLQLEDTAYEEQTTNDEGLESDDIHQTTTDPDDTADQRTGTEFESESESKVESRLNSRIESKNEFETESVTRLPIIETDFVSTNVEEDEGIDEEEVESSEKQDETEESLKQIPRYLDPDQEKAAYLQSEYMKLVMTIESQNKNIDELKRKIREKCRKCPRLQCDEREIRNLHCCLESEEMKLQCLIRKVIDMQNRDPNHQWEPITIATSLEEDIPFRISNLLPEICENTSNDTTEKDTDEDDNNHQQPCAHSGEINEMEKFLDCLARQIKSKKLESMKSKTCKPPTCDVDPCEIEKLMRNFNMQEKLVASNSSLERDRFKIQEEILCRDRIIDCLQQKLQLLQSEICKKRREQLKHVSDRLKMQSPPPELKNIAHRCSNFEKDVHQMQPSIERLKVEMDSLKRENNYWDDQLKYQNYDNDLTSHYSGRMKIKNEKLRNLRHAYETLLADCAKKEAELKHLREQVKNYIIDQRDDEIKIPREGENNNFEDTEIRILRDKLKDLTEEQEEFKFLIKEQAHQLDELRSKYIATQQKVEENKCLIEKSDMSSKRIEEQVATELKRITWKFQQKCEELMKFPKLLEQEQLKLANCMKQKGEVQQKLNIVCKEYNSLKRQFENNADGPDNVDWLTKTKQTEQEVLMLKEKCEIMKKNKSAAYDSLIKAKSDYETLKTESTRILARSKERAEQQKKVLTEYKNKLEKELAQCRAASVINITDRDELIKDLQGQINALSFSFEAATEQIANLQNQISHLSGIEV